MLIYILSYVFNQPSQKWLMFLQPRDFFDFLIIYILELIFIRCLSKCMRNFIYNINSVHLYVLTCQIIILRCTYYNLSV